MPQLVKSLVPAGSIKAGDVITRQDGGTVASVDRKVKWTTISFTAGGRPLRVEVDAMLEVERSEPTQAEREATMLQYRLYALDRAERGAADALVSAQAKLQSDIENGYQVGYGRLDDLLEAQSVNAVWAKVTHLQQVQANRAVSFDESTGTWSLRADADVAAEQDGKAAMDRLACVEYMIEKVKEELIEYTQYTSRSTSVISNAIEDYDRQAKARFVSRSYRGF